MNIRRKIETGINDYVRTNRGQCLKTLKIIDGHDNQVPEIPFLTGYCGHAPPHPDLGQECGAKLAQHVFHLKTQAEDEPRKKADNRIEELIGILSAPVDPHTEPGDGNKAFGKLVAALNANEDLGLHVYDIYPSDDVNAFEGKNWHDQIVLSVVCQEV